VIDSGSMPGIQQCGRVPEDMIASDSAPISAGSWSAAPVYLERFGIPSTPLT